MSLDVKITKEKVEYNGAKYVKVDREAEVGDLIRITAVCDEDYSEAITIGGFYEVNEIDKYGDPQIIDDAGNNYDTSFDKFEVFAKKLKVGDLARVIENTECMIGFKVGDIVKIVSDGEGGKYDLKIAGFNDLHYGYCDYEHLEPYTYKDSDTIEIDGTTYALRDRKAKVGEKVLVIARNSGHTLPIGAVIKVNVADEDDGSVTDNAGKARWLFRNTNSGNEYLVLDPQSSSIEWADSAKEQAETAPKFKVGDIAKVIAEEYGHGFEIGAKVKIVGIDENDDILHYRAKNVKTGVDWWVSDAEIEPVTDDEQPATTTFEVATKAGSMHVISEKGEAGVAEFVKAYTTLIYGKAFFMHPTVFLPLDDIESIKPRRTNN